MRNFQFIMSVLLLFMSSAYAQVSIIEEAGWFESAYVKWTATESPDSFRVYYTGEGIVDKKIDDQLIRNYGSYYRADVLGLKAGKYTLKIENALSAGEWAVSKEITVKAYDRTGFAFINGRVPGAYKVDGTPKSDALILYITENTKNTISVEVAGANSNPCVGLQTILEGFKKGVDTRPLIIRLVGQITDMEYMEKGDIVIENKNNATSYITLEGVGDDAVADGWGIRVKNAVNTEIRNIGTMNCNSDEGDNIGLQQNNQYIWIHHNDFFYGDAGGDSDQAKGDGALDCKTSGYVTIAYNHFWDSGKSNLLGNGTEPPEYLTYHHNWYDHSDSRHPRVRNHSVHVYNNYYDGNSKYGVGSTLGSSVFVEANYFRNCKYPMLISMQGSDVYDEGSGSNDYGDMPTFSSEEGGIIKSFNNYITGAKRFVTYGNASFPNSTVDFDAYETSTKDQKLSTLVKSAEGSNTYNNFDADPSIMYTYKADAPESARDSVIKYAGRMSGGDFAWVFNNAADDISYAVNAGLKTALPGYTTNLISVQGDSDPVSTEPTDTSGSEPGDTTRVEPVEGDEIHNFTLSGLNSTFYSITGNLSDSKGTVYFGELSLTQCLKIESSTSISFTLTEEAELTLIFNKDYSGAININGDSYNISSGILYVTLQPDSYEITKDDVANLYFINLEYADEANTAEIVENQTNDIQLTVYPNPSTGIINIECNAAIYNVQFYSFTGEMVYDSNTNSKNIDVSHFTTGIYSIVVFSDKGKASKVFMKR